MGRRTRWPISLWWWFRTLLDLTLSPRVALLLDLGVPLHIVTRIVGHATLDVP